MRYNFTPRNIAIAVLLILTLILGIVSIVIAIRLGQSTTSVDLVQCTGDQRCSGAASNFCQGTFACECLASRKAGCSNDIFVVRCGNTASPSCSGGTTGSGTGGTTGSGPVGQGGACSPAANECASGLVCTPSSVNGPNVCNVPPSGSGCTGGNTCSAYLGFKCDQLVNGECSANGSSFNSFSEAASYAGGCGQVDQVCTGGTPGNNQLCGSFQVINTSCFVNPPPVTPPPVTPPPVTPPPVEPPVTPPPPPPVSSPTLPETAVISNEADRLMLGFMLILLGLITYRFNVFGRLVENLNLLSDDSAVKHSPLQRFLRSRRGDFEKKVQRDFEKEN
ncbi:MAG: hypothetical protein ABI721_05470 [Candidatus Dojkabacteria bacterium]